MPQAEARLCPDLEKEPLRAAAAFSPGFQESWKTAFLSGVSHLKTTEKPNKLILRVLLDEKLRTWALRSEERARPDFNRRSQLWAHKTAGNRGGGATCLRSPPTFLMGPAKGRTLNAKDSRPLV